MQVLLVDLLSITLFSSAEGAMNHQKAEFVVWVLLARGVFIVLHIYLAKILNIRIKWVGGER